MNEETIIEWQAPEFNYVEKEPIWFLSMGLFATLFVIYAIWQQNLLFAIFIIISAVVLIYWAKEKPKTLQFTLNSEGITISDYNSYTWNSLQNFALIKSHIEHDHLAELIVKRIDKFNPYVKIHVPVERASEIREYLLKHIKEEENYMETYSDAIQRLIKF